MTYLYSTRPDPVLTPADVTRFWSWVEKTDGCWLWRGSPKSHHPRFTVAGASYACYRISYLLCVGPIPAGLGVCHTCDNGRCVNPVHLWLGTQTDNVRDRDRKGRTPAGTQHYTRQHPERVSKHLRTGARKLNPEQVRQIRARFAAGASKKGLARAYGVDKATIRDLLAGKTWKSVV